MKILFLDIDGVCNSAQYARKLYEERGHGGLIGIDPVPTKLVHRIIEETGCKVVLSSTWRLYEGAREQVRNEVCEFIDVTADHQRGAKWGAAPRGGEVREWLNAHPEVERYAILDDNSDFYADQYLFLTTWERGLTPEIADKVIAHLNS